MQQLLNEDRMMLVVSEGYLKGSANDYDAEACEKNWYCAYELADAINARLKKLRFLHGLGRRLFAALRRCLSKERDHQ